MYEIIYDSIKNIHNDYKKMEYIEASDSVINVRNIYTWYEYARI